MRVQRDAINTTGLTWLDRLDMAESVPEILELVRVYTAQFGPAEVALLPAKCRPRKLMDANDLAEYALELVRFTLDGAPSNAAAKLAAVVSHAATRMSQLAAANDSDGGRAQSA